MRPRLFLEANGAALLLSLPYFAQLLFPGDIALYHHHRRLTHTLCGLLLAMLIVAVLAFGLLAYIRYRFPSKPRAIIGAALASLVIIRAIQDGISIFKQWNSGLNPNFGEGVPLSSVYARAMNLRLDGPLPLLLIAAVAALAWWRPPITRRFVKVTRLGLAAFAFCLLWIVPQLLYLAFALKPTPRTSPSLNPASTKRIVWILFDELSYKLTFDQPPPGMDFPSFRALRAGSVSFADVQPPGYFTDRIVPSVIAGKQIQEIRSDKDRRLFYMNEAERRWIPFDQNQTLFGIAHSAGWNSGVAGWYNPYCRIFSSLLDSCMWEPLEVLGLPLETLGATESKSIAANAAILAPAILTGRSPSEAEIAAPRIRVYSNLMAQARKLIRDERIDFVFIHLNVPHPPGFYDRKTHKLCTCGNYIDNLALADEALGQLQEEIKHSPQADQTTLIVSSDHSWRLPLWRDGTYWTPEEERISQGQFDPRAVLLIHFPGQKSAIDIPNPEPELIEHDIIASMLQNKLNTPDDLLSFPHPSPQQAFTRPVR